MSAKNEFEIPIGVKIDYASNEVMDYVNEIREEIVILLLQKFGCGGENDLGITFGIDLDDIRKASQYTVAVKSNGGKLHFKIFKKKSH